MSNKILLTFKCPLSKLRLCFFFKAVSIIENIISISLFLQPKLSALMFAQDAPYDGVNRMNLYIELE